MGNVILYMGMSLDGCIAGKNDDMSWLDPYNDIDYGFKEFYAGVGAAIEGKRTWELGQKYGWDKEWNVPMIVLSQDIPQSPPKPDTHFMNADIADALAEARRLTDKNIWVVGGANIAQQFLARGLVDEMVLGVVPVILGEGIKLFEHINHAIPLTLTDMKRFDKGLILLFYAKQ